MDLGGELSFFQGIFVKIDVRIDISISIRPMTAIFGEQVHLQDSTHISIIRVFMATKLGRMAPYLMDSCPLSHTTLWSHGLVRSHDQRKSLYLHYHSAYGHQTWQDGN